MSQIFRQLSDCTSLALTSLLLTLGKQLTTCFIDTPVATKILCILMKGTVYHSQAYLRVKNRNSYTVAYTEDMWSSKALLNIFLVYVPTQLLLSHLHTWKVKFYNRLQDSTELEAKAYFSNMNAHCIARNEVNRSLIQLGGGEFPLCVPLASHTAVGRGFVME